MTTLTLRADGSALIQVDEGVPPPMRGWLDGEAYMLAVDAPVDVVDERPSKDAYRAINQGGDDRTRL